MKTLMEIKNLSVKYGEHHVLNKINMVFEKNKITALIGPSGCGKTTLLKTLNGLIEEEKNISIEGDIFLENKRIADIDSELLRKEVGIVFQTPTPFPFSVQKNMYYPIDYHLKVDNQFKKDLVEEKLKSVGLYDEVKNRMNLSALKLSGGQQQRLCIARTLTLNPKILLLDEPCSSLDPKSTQKIENTLIHLSKEITIIIVTHNMQQAKRIADNVAFIYEGKLMEYKNKDDFFSNPQNEVAKNYIDGIIG